MKLIPTKWLEKATLNERLRKILNDIIFFVNCLFVVGWAGNLDSLSFFCLIPSLMILLLYVSNEPKRYLIPLLLLIILAVGLNVLKYRGSRVIVPANGRYIVLEKEICIRGDRSGSTDFGTQEVAYFEEFIDGRCDKRFENKSNREKYLVAPAGTKLQVTDTFYRNSYGLGGDSGYYIFVPTPVGTLKLSQYYGQERVEHILWENGDYVYEKEFYRDAIHIPHSIYTIWPFLFLIAGIPGLLIVLIVPVVIVKLIDKKGLFSLYAKIGLLLVIMYPFLWFAWGRFFDIK